MGYAENLGSAVECPAMISVSIISHGHGQMVSNLIQRLLECPEVGQILLTRNIPESVALPEDSRLTLIENPAPKGFAANHNQAFTQSLHPYFCPLNPDIILLANPFGPLVAAMERHQAAVTAPLVVSASGSVEDSMRTFPTLRSLLGKALGHDAGRHPVVIGQSPFYPDWVAGMFLLFRREAYARLGGFDEGFFLYYEDVDLCARAWRLGLKILACPAVTVRHDAHRQSRRDMRFMRWHLSSMLRYFVKHWWRLPKVDRREAC